MVNYANELSGKLLEILRKLSRQKLVCEKRYIAACCMVCAGYLNNTVDSFNYFSTKFK